MPCEFSERRRRAGNCRSAAASNILAAKDGWMRKEPQSVSMPTSCFDTGARTPSVSGEVGCGMRGLVAATFDRTRRVMTRQRTALVIEALLGVEASGEAALAQLCRARPDAGPVVPDTKHPRAAHALASEVAAGADAVKAVGKKPRNPPPDSAGSVEAGG